MKTTRLLIFFQYTLVVAFFLPTTVAADTETITVCAHPEGDPNRFMVVDISAEMNNRRLDVSTERLTSGCISVSLEQCTASVTIKVFTEITHRGEAKCKPSPPDLRIAMQSQRWDYTARALGFLDQEKTSFLAFDSEGFEAALASSDSALADLPEDARKADTALFVALAAGDFAKAQRQANEVASYLRQADNERLSLAYSTITYVAGFNAMGVDPLARENPLVTTVGSVDPAFLVLSTEGGGLLKMYQTLRAVQSQPGVWDFPTTSTISNIQVPMDDFRKFETIVLPRGLRVDQVSIDDAGRLNFPEHFDF